MQECERERHNDKEIEKKQTETENKALISRLQKQNATLCRVHM